MRPDVDAIVASLEPFDPLVVWLFGSSARGTGRADSDVDVAFLPARRCDSYAVFRAAQEIATRLGREVDLVDLSRATTVMRAEVLRTGERIVCRDETRADEFAMYTLSDRALLQEERAQAVQGFIARVRGEVPE